MPGSRWARSRRAPRANPRARDGADPGAGRRARANDEPRRRRVRRRRRRPSSAPAGRWFHYGLTSSDVLDTALALTVRDAGGLVLERHRPRVVGGRRAGGGASRHPDDRQNARRPRRADDIRAQARRVGVSARARPAPRRERPRGHARREAERRGRNVLGNAARGGATCVREPRARAGSELDADPPAGPPRGASVGARAARLVAGALRARDPAPGAHRGA